MEYRKILEAVDLSEKKLIIQPQKYGGESSVISMRMPKEMLAEIDKIVLETGRTRNEILMLSIEFALEHMEVQKK
ncbi:MAG: hypothetical protein J6A92_03615 [Lachnospiraceae bacterium]|nr:hypothetical protein [Lachnospiraceae bacterium]